ncbi:nuclear transport factor 2 family protein [Streptomyces violaceorubidus]
MTAQAPTAPADVYAEVQHFYARQMRLLDTGEADAWAGTFTEDGSFAPPSRPQPVRGRPALAAGARQSAADIAARGETQRHWVGMLTVTPADDGSLTAESQVTIITVPRGGPARLHLVCTCHDVLASEAGELLVRERVVTRDDQP